MTQTQKSHPLSRLWGYATVHRRAMIVASLYSILNKIFDLAPPILIGAAVDVVVQQENSLIAKYGVEDTGSQLLVLAGLTVFIWVFESIFQYLYQVAWRNLAQTIQHDLRIDTYDHVQHLRLAYFEDRSTGGLLSVINNDVNQLERFLNGGVNDIWQVTTTVIVIGGIFFYTAPSVAWMAMLPMPFIIWGSIRFQHTLAPKYAAVREQVGVLNGQLANNLSGIATIKSFTAENHELERVTHESNLYRIANKAAIKFSSAFVPLIRMIIMSGFIAILIFGGRMALSGEIAIGVYSVLIFITQRLLWPLTHLGETLDLYQRSMASTDRVLDLLDADALLPDGETPLDLSVVRGEIRLDSVSFEYDNTDNLSVIDDLSLKIPAGETVGIVGSTGAGKTTLVKLLLRFYDVQKGSLSLDGLDLRDIQVEYLRKAIGFVSQDVYLFHGTVRENIAYGTFDASDEEIIEAAKIAEAHDFIMDLPQGYNTIVGERGQKLSGGQRQRVSIARAVLKNPPVLILDEATSSVDNETEALIQRSLEQIAIGRTTIVIAHRLSTIRNADRIFVLEHGKLKEQGRHDELVAEGGIYARLWGVQTGVRRD
ncbi:MAG: ABC transporter ATP-binding protein [Anaerolineales bacterium]|uniref:ABC transporter ATP-binding protein n=1 Tax=Candidatus Desulfolinea nitratireducens TaxID=2841698 RepID=A0A8J6NIC9_9CHLR|nr:ABC transporter ATP-binding protein [Candidatus Desulfolinea nitratireducens]MBL6959967.1 ABC transporter ATP-binding protein [Anaerolineales bacterium]